MPIRNAVLHLLSAAVIALTGAGVILWALLSRPRIRWDRFRIGLALLILVAPAASLLAAAQLGNAFKAANGLEADLDWSEIEMDSTPVVDSVIAARVDPVSGIVVDTVAAGTIESN